MSVCIDSSGEILKCFYLGIQQHMAVIVVIISGIPRVAMVS